MAAIKNLDVQLGLNPLSISYVTALGHVRGACLWRSYARVGTRMHTRAHTHPTRAHSPHRLPCPPQRYPMRPLSEWGLHDDVVEPVPGLPVFGVYSHLSNGHPVYSIVQHDGNNYPYVR